MKLYTELAEFYYEIEKPARDFLNEIQFLKEIFQKLKINKIMDIGCGTGEHVSTLNQAGYKCFGVDASIEMLEIAKNRFPGSTFKSGKLQEFISKEPMDAVICLFGSINYLISEKELNLAFSNIVNSLVPGGLFILEAWNAFPIRQIKRKPITSVSVSRVGNTLIQRNRGFRLQENGSKESLVEVNFIYNVNTKRVQDKHIMRVFYPEEIIEILQNNKLNVIATYGDYKKSPLKKHSSRMIILCKSPLK